MPLERMLRIHFLQQWYQFSDPGMEEALYEIPLLRQFVGINLGRDLIPDETILLKFRRLLERHDLAPKIFAEVQTVLQWCQLDDGAGSAICGLGTVRAPEPLLDGVARQTGASPNLADGYMFPEEHPTNLRIHDHGNHLFIPPA